MASEMSEVKKALLKRDTKLEEGNVKAVEVKVTPRNDVHQTTANDMNDNNIGLALSGGGVRSAAFSSGVLRRLLQKSIEVDYISCISGGNFTAAAYIDWKYRHGRKDNHKWHHEFFEYMRERTGYLCDWTNTFKGLHDVMVVLLLLLFVNLFIPIVLWGALSIPVAYGIDVAFGGIMRIGFDCENNVIPYGATNANRTISKCGTRYDSHDHEAFKQISVLAALAVSFLTFYTLKRLIFRLRSLFAFFQIVSGVLLAMVLLPWFLHQFTDVIPLWLIILILCLSTFFWCGFPPLRNIAALAIIFYMYAFIVRWRVYRSSFPIQYTETHFYTALLVAGALLWASPYLGIFTRTAIYNFAKWRLQHAFFTRESVGRYGCHGITCSDFFPILSALFRRSTCRTKDDERALTMASVADMKPQYISNLVADYWRRNDDPKTVPETMISLSSKEIEVITEQPGLDVVQCSLNPKHIMLADAMTTAALVVRPPREKDSSFEPFRELQIILGLALTNRTNSAPDEDYGCACKALKILPFILQSIAGAPVILLAVVWLADLSYEPSCIEQVVMIVFISYIVIFGAIAVMPTGSEKGWFGERIARWCHVHLYHVRFMREFMKINNVGPMPPALINLSDLGRVEKYGLLALFKRRMKKIVVVDGSYMRNDNDYAKQVLKSMQLAREYFYCEFLGYDNRDVIGEIYKRYIATPAEKHTRSYRFVVKYFDKTEEGYKPAGQGEILLLAPRHPDKGVAFPNGKDMTWGEYTRDTEIALDPQKWGTGPLLKAEEVDRLTFCCCECCHCSNKVSRWLSKKLCNGFPHHSTVNQLFTPSMFSAYHREGYRVSIEADVEGFLKGSRR